MGAIRETHHPWPAVVLVGEPRLGPHLDAFGEFPRWVPGLLEQGNIRTHIHELPPWLVPSCDVPVDDSEWFLWGVHLRFPWRWVVFDLAWSSPAAPTMPARILAQNTSSLPLAE